MLTSNELEFIRGMVKEHVDASKNLEDVWVRLDFFLDTLEVAKVGDGLTKYAPVKEEWCYKSPLHFGIYWLALFCFSALLLALFALFTYYLFHVTLFLIR